jgi:hypothetical protein
MRLGRVQCQGRAERVHTVHLFFPGPVRVTRLHTDLSFQGVLLFMESCLILRRLIAVDPYACMHCTPSLYSQKKILGAGQFVAFLVGYKPGARHHACTAPLRYIVKKRFLGPDSLLLS